MKLKTKRRTVLKWLAASVPLSFLPKILAARTDDIRHILPTVTDTTFSISVSVGQPRSMLQLLVDGKEVPGKKMDSKGRFWSFYADGLKSLNTYDLQLVDKSGALGEPWSLRTFPGRNTEPETFKLLAFTCAGGADGLGMPSVQFFKPHSFRQKLFEGALKEQPDAAIAIGDHIYYDLRRGASFNWQKLEMAEVFFQLVFQHALRQLQQVRVDHRHRKRGCIGAHR